MGGYSSSRWHRLSANITRWGSRHSHQSVSYGGGPLVQLSFAMDLRLNLKYVNDVKPAFWRVAKMSKKNWCCAVTLAR